MVTPGVSILPIHLPTRAQCVFNYMHSFRRPRPPAPCMTSVFSTKVSCLTDMISDSLERKDVLPDA